EPGTTGGAGAVDLRTAETPDSRPHRADRRGDGPSRALGEAQAEVRTRRDRRRPARVRRSAEVLDARGPDPPGPRTAREPQDRWGQAWGEALRPPCARHRDEARGAHPPANGRERIVAHLWHNVLIAYRRLSYARIS